MSHVERLACTKVLSMSDSCYQAALFAISLPLREICQVQGFGTILRNI
jgi:hypothetical protein